ncbi:SGNH hydrolase-type esterase domain-containing protein [Dactylonectria estremocensis]|uniref:SGNH hydrolase-type esterase domain-containing protein n=1 Tax=Dactylonectria estremocensis TaxID=1079267 RepID=A0A9P9FK70_9HYPO|nr:SGNH hydrolase-type esterase domain-containing protein [Dactylonectria estremocensis]
MATTYPQVVLLGDSLFQHAAEVLDGFSFQSALQRKFWRRLDIVNRGLSGWNSSHALQYIPDIFPERNGDLGPKMDYLVILLGANDAVIELPTTSQHVPIHQYKENLTKIINHPRITAHKPKILLVAPPPLDQIKVTVRNVAEGHSQATRTSAISASYSEVAREVAKENPGVVLIDLWKAIMDKAIKMAAPGDYTPGGPWLGSPESGKQGGLDELLPDGLHMSGKAYEVFYDTIVPHIGQEWQALEDDDRAGYLLPDWRDLCGAK